MKTRPWFLTLAIASHSEQLKRAARCHHDGLLLELKLTLLISSGLVICRPSSHSSSPSSRAHFETLQQIRTWYNTGDTPRGQNHLCLTDVSMEYLYL